MLHFKPFRRQENQRWGDLPFLLWRVPGSHFAGRRERLKSLFEWLYVLAWARFFSELFKSISITLPGTWNLGLKIHSQRSPTRDQVYRPWSAKTSYWPVDESFHADCLESTIIPSSFQGRVHIVPSCHPHRFLHAVTGYILRHIQRRPAEAIFSLRRGAEGHTWNVVPDYLLGIEKLRISETKNYLDFLNIGSFAPNCHFMAFCTNPLNVARATNLPQCYDTSTTMLKCASNLIVGEIFSSTQLCDACASSAENLVWRGRENVWNELPELFGMSECDLLRAKEIISVRKFTLMLGNH